MPGHLSSITVTEKHIKCISLTIIMGTEDRYQLWKIPIHFKFTKNTNKWKQSCQFGSTCKNTASSQSSQKPQISFSCYYRAVPTVVLPAMGYKYYFTTETVDLKSSKQIWNSYFLFILNEQQKLLFPTIYEVTSSLVNQ